MRALSGTYFLHLGAECSRQCKSGSCRELRLNIDIDGHDGHDCYTQLRSAEAFALWDDEAAIDVKTLSCPRYVSEET